MKALVTGCAGFIGSNITETLLQRGYEVVGIDSFTDYYPRFIKETNIQNILKNSNFRLINEDILNMVTFPEVDMIFHLAAQPGVRSSWGNQFYLYVKNNIEATQKLLEFYKEKEINKFVYSSSSSIYGDAELPMRENCIPKPVSPYGVSKLAGENLNYLYWSNYNMPTIALRYFTVYGPRQRPDMAINKFVTAILEGKEILIFGDGKQRRDFTYISDVVDANILASESSETGKAFNIGGGSDISVNDLISLISELAETPANIRYTETQKGDVRDTLADTHSSMEYLHWAPQVNIKEGLTRYIQWFRDNQ
jgi:UDP-glucose 4-epimerase